MRIWLIISSVAIILLAAVLNGCEDCCELEGGGVPAYIRVDTMRLQTNYDSSGTNSHKIENVWVSVGNEYIGTYELPATIPILNTGRQELRLNAGILENGIQNTRIAYPFYGEWKQTVDLVPESVQTINPTVRYRSNISYLWQEDFERDNRYTLIADTVFSSVPFDVTTDPEEVFEGRASMKVTIPSSGRVELLSSASYQYTPGRAIFMEMNFKTDVETLVGFYTVSPSGGVTQEGHIFLNTTEDWRKIYINFTGNMSRFEPGTVFTFFFGNVNQSAEPAELLFDNIKLITVG